MAVDTNKYEKVSFEDIPFESDNPEFDAQSNFDDYNFDAGTPKNEGFLNQTKAIGVRALQSPYKLMELAQDVVDYGAEKIFGSADNIKIKNPFGGEPLKTNLDPLPRVSDRIADLFGGEESLKPNNFIAEVAQLVAGGLPLLPFGGGSILAKLGADVLSSTGMTVAKRAGFGPLGQLGAGILSHAGLSGVVNSFKKMFGEGVKASPSKINNFTKALYESEKKLGQRAPFDSAPLRKEFVHIYDDLQKELTSSRGLTKTAKDSVAENIGKIDQLLGKEAVNGSDLFEVKKLLNKTWTPVESVEKTFIDRLLGAVNKNLDSLAKKHPEWGSSWKKADELYKIQKWETGLSRWASSPAGSDTLAKMSTHPIAIGALSILSGLKFGLPGIAAGALPYVAKEGALAAHTGMKAMRFVKSLSQTKDGQKLLWEIVANSTKSVGAATTTKNNALASNINRLNSAAKIFDKKYATPTKSFKTGPVDMNKYEKVSFEDIPF